MTELKKDSALLAFKEDVEDRNVFDTLSAHLTYKKPVHRYEGNITLEENRIIFAGVDIKTEKDFFLEIPKNIIKQIHLGFDEIYTESEDRLMGKGFRPVRISYSNGNEIINAYFIIEFDRVDGMKSKNEIWFELLQTWL